MAGRCGCPLAHRELLGASLAIGTAHSLPESTSAAAARTCELLSLEAR
jgi:hypothetical protein